MDTYEQRVVEYLLKNKNNFIIYKVRNERMLSCNELMYLENIFWVQLGSKDEYITTYNKKEFSEVIIESVGFYECSCSL